MFSIKNLFYLLDVFKAPLTLRFKNKRFISTSFGLSCSVAIFTILVIMIFNSDLFEKASPQIISSLLPLTHRPLISLKKKIVAFGVQSDSDVKGFVDSSYFKLSIRSMTYTSNPEGGFDEEAKERQFHICSQEDFKNPSTFEELGLANCFCMDEEYNIDLEGFWDENKVKYETFDFFLCNNITDNVTCKSFEEMKEKMNGMTFNIYFEDTIIDSRDYNNPIKRAIVNKYMYIDLDFYKSKELYFTKTTLKSDDGWIMNNIKEFSDIYFNSEISDFNSVSNEDFDESRASFTLYSSKQEQKISRQYIKLTDLLAKLGGILQGLIMVCYIFVYMEQSLYIKNHILNSLYVFQRKDPKNQGNSLTVKPFTLNNHETNSEKQLDVVKKSLHDNGEKKNFFFSFGRKRKVLQFQDIKNQQGQQKLTLGLLKYLILKLKKIFPCIMRLSFEEEIFDKSEKIYEQELDFIQILKKLQEFEKLKKIIFNPKQLAIFRFLSKPMLCIDHNPNSKIINTKNSIYLNFSYDKKKELKEALDYYENKQLSEMEERLFNLMNEEMRNFSKSNIH